MNRKDKSDDLQGKSHFAKQNVLTSEPKDKSDTRSVAFNEVESSDQ